MIYNNDCTLPKEYLEQLTAEWLESLPEMIRLLVNQAMQIGKEWEYGRLFLEMESG